MSRLSCSDLRILFRETSTAVVIVDTEGRIRVVNRKAADLFGYDPDELRGERVEVLVPEGLEEKHRSHRADYMEDPARRPMGFGLELEAVRSDGTTFPVEIGLSPMELDGGRRVMAAVRDISERSELRRWGAEAVEAAEEERLRIAQELHDDLAQRLAALQMQAKVIGEAQGERRDAIAEQMRVEVRSASEHLREVIRGLRPPALTELGLLPALHHETHRLLEGSGIDRELNIQKIERRPANRVELVLYRVTQEAVRNAVQHGDPSRISVSLEMRDDAWIELAVEDDGRGFDPDRAGDGERYGLVGMRERVGAVGGRIELETAPGEGTSVRARVPTAVRG